MNNSENIKILILSADSIDSNMINVVHRHMEHPNEIIIIESVKNIDEKSVNEQYLIDKYGDNISVVNESLVDLETLELLKKDSYVIQSVKDEMSNDLQESNEPFMHNSNIQKRKPKRKPKNRKTHRRKK